MADDPADRLTVSGAIGVRYGAVDGQARAGLNANDDQLNIRTKYRTRDMRFGVELCDSRVFGDDAGTPVTAGEVNALEPVQTYVAADILTPFGKGAKLTVTAGRMMRLGGVMAFRNALVNRQRSVRSLRPLGWEALDIGRRLPGRKGQEYADCIGRPNRLRWG
ncbi:hypothetical protein [Sphingobium cupriresistens]|uniref:Uncharacterized protein n=1 Tax=Sphingobium cupriresistens TaxID=1132417 RepID=A0A8G2DXJ2_9SPHN|nr:hypothetical protein [Sphingobium cupriresistens]RYM05355.1 hypothetical protein EWH12_21265 [Sphingobium cupriresistens]